VRVQRQPRLLLPVREQPQVLVRLRELLLQQVLHQRQVLRWQQPQVSLGQRFVPGQKSLLKADPGLARGR
jgi:hypothetical protein